MKKLFLVLPYLVLLFIAVEVGYAWGVSKTATKTQKAIFPSSLQSKPAVTFSPLFNNKSIEIMKNFADSGQGLTTSELKIEMWGKLENLSNDALQFRSSGELKTLPVPAGVEIRYGQWSNSRKKLTPLDHTSVKIGEVFGVNYTIDTTSGQVKSIQIIKGAD